MSNRKVVFNKAAQNRGNNKAGIKRLNSFKGFAYVLDDNNDIKSVDLLVQTIIKAGASETPRSRYVNISTKELNALLEKVGLTPDEMEDRNGTLMFVDDDGLAPISQSDFYGVKIHNQELSAISEMSVFSHLFAGIENAVYERKQVEGLGIRGEYITTLGVRCLAAIVKNELVLEPIYVDYTINRTDEKIDGKTVKDTSFDEMIAHFNDTNSYGVDFTYFADGYMNAEELMQIYQDNDLHAPTLTRAIDGDDQGNGAVEFDFVEFDFIAALKGEKVVKTEPSKEAGDTKAPILLELAGLTTKPEIKALAAKLGYTETFKNSDAIPAMKQAVATFVNGLDKVPF